MKKLPAFSCSRASVRRAPDTRLIEPWLQQRRHAALVHHSFSEGGFTLIELMVVLVIIAILAALTIGATKFAWRKAAESRAQAEVASMETALEQFKNDNGAYP